MRKPVPHVHEDGTKTYRVRFRSAGSETSRTFYQKHDAEMFARIMGPGRPRDVQEALAWLAAKDAEVETATFSEWFTAYLAQLSGITSRTKSDYEAMHRRYLTSLDDLPISLITRAHVAGIVNDLDARKLSPKTIKNAIHMLSSVMALAVDEGHVTRNPVRRVRLPQQSLADSDPKFLTTQEAASLVAATEAHYRPLVTFLLGTGLRWSEATALQARHVDLQAGTVRVQRAWKRVAGGWEIGPPKSAKSNRTVNAGVPALLAVAGMLGKPDDLIFKTPTGKVVRHSNFYNRVWVPACEKAGLSPRPSPHDCRHTFASWLISEGIGLEAVQDQLGHESYETTRKVYAKLLPAVGVAAGRAASAAMARMLLAVEAADEVVPFPGPQVLEANVHHVKGDAELDGHG